MENLDLGSGRVYFSMIIGIISLIYMILYTKIHPFLALISAAILIGILLGLPLGSIGSIITKGFGGTLGSIGIIIGFGVMMGELFEISGAAKRMAKTFLKLFGKGREEIALAFTGFIISIPIFCDSAFIVLSPIVKALSRRTNKSVVSLGVALALGLVITHSLVPPTPGPVGVAGIFGVSIGSLMLWGLVIAIPATLVSLIYVKKYLEKKYFYVVGNDGEITQKEYESPIYSQKRELNSENMPSTINSFAPILLPIILILTSSIMKVMGSSGTFSDIIYFLGMPVIAVGIGLLWALFFLAAKIPREKVVNNLDKSLAQAAVIIFVTGGGGALGQILRDSGAGKIIAETLVEYSIPAILLPVIIATFVRFIQGSGTVSMITAASVSAPVLTNLDGNMVFYALSACVGSLFFGYFNDSYFWVVNRTLGIIKTKDQIQVWSITSTISWAISLAVLLILNAIFG